MSSLRSAIIWASVGQYLSIAINFSVTMFLARLLTPAEFGIASIGLAILGIAEAIRELGGGTFLIREHDLTHDKIRSSTTINLLMTLIIAPSLLVLAHPLADFFAKPELAPYLSIAAIGYALGTLLYPQQALMSRHMAFDRLAIVNCGSTLVGACVAVTLALAGFRSNSFAWAGAATSFSATLMCFAFSSDLSIFRPSLCHWRSVVSFGAYSSATVILGKVAESVPLLIFGRLLSAAEVAIGHRAVLLCLFPEKLLLAAVSLVALPALSRQSREGGDLKNSYLKALSSIMAVHWPVMTMLALLAHPVVLLVLGEQWVGSAPLVGIISPALMLAVPIALQFPTLIAAGGVKLLPRVLAVQVMVTTAALLIAAPHGLQAAALSMLVSMPLTAAISLWAVRSKIHFRFSELVAAVVPSIITTLAAACGPILFSLAFSSEMPLPAAIAAAASGGIGWLIALYVVDHPLWVELFQAATAFAGSPFFQRLRSSRG